LFAGNSTPVPDDSTDATSGLARVLYPGHQSQYSRTYGHIKDVYGITQVKGEEGPTVKITVAIDSQRPLPKNLALGTTVTANVRCGRCSLGYSWFHEGDGMGAETHSLLKSNADFHSLDGVEQINARSRRQSFVAVAFTTVAAIPCTRLAQQPTPHVPSSQMGRQTPDRLVA
jgi:hypothetical protein